MGDAAGIEGALRIERVPVARARAAAAVIRSSHSRYPAWTALFPRPSARRRALGAFFHATFLDAARLGSAWWALDDDGPAAVCVWRPPGEGRWSRARTARAVPRMLVVALAAPRAMPRFAALGERALGVLPDDAWSLEVLGVRRGRQGGGAGSALVRHGLGLVDAEAAPAFLATSDPANATWYARFGFTVVDPAAELVPGGPTHVLMRRAPRGAEPDRADATTGRPAPDADPERRGPSVGGR